LTSLTGSSGLATGFYRIDLVRRINRWLHTSPQPSVVVEIADDHVAAARQGSGRGRLDAFAVEPLPAGSVMASPLETNVTQPDTVRSALRRVFQSVPAHGEPVVLLVPDPVVRVFILPFDSLPRKTEEALPLLRWRLKKSVPFDMDETSVSWMRQNGREDSLEVVTAVARKQILREYEQIVESLGGHPTVLMSSTLAVLPLLEDTGATLLARFCGKTLTSAVVQGSNLCVYRSTDMAGGAAHIDPRAMLDEVFPVVAYFQDTWRSTIDRARLSGFGSRQDSFGEALADELKIPVNPLTQSQGARALEGPAKDLMHRGLDSLAGWMMNEGS
jgi:type IV pilus assembly protein PilM